MAQDDIAAEIRAARAAGRQLAAAGVLARTAGYDRQNRRVLIELHNGVSLAVPAALIEGLDAATDDQRERIEISPTGYGLHWPDLDLDISVPGLMAGVFGTKAWMDRLRAARAGSSSSPAKAEAARRNGAKGGRPRKSVA